jgi:hypothetical protein
LHYRHIIANIGNGRKRCKRRETIHNGRSTIDNCQPNNGETRR